MVRDIAFKITGNVLLKGETLKTQNFDNGLSVNDKAFLKLIVFSVFRHLNKLDKIIAKFVKKKPDKHVKIFLYLGISQILFLNVPEHAAIFETVEAIKRSLYKNNANFINGVLRSVTRDKEIPDVSNFPDKFHKLLRKEYSQKDILELSKLIETEPCIDIHVKDNASFFAEKLNASVLSKNVLRLNETKPIFELFEYENGKWWIQSFAASLPVSLFSNLKGKKVADFCAAPGGKTFQMINEGADVTAFDISKKRLDIMKENLKRLNFNASIINADPSKYDFKESFDAILVDTPCSGTGTFRKNPDVVLKELDFKKLYEIQTSLLKAAVLNVKINGEIVYSSCSLLKSEGEKIVKDLLKSSKNCILKKEIRLLPDEKFGEGFYMALIERIL